MNRLRRQNLFPTVAVLGLLLAALACTIGPGASSKPTVVVTFPGPGGSFARGREIVVQSVSAVTDARAIVRVELWVDGQLVNTQVLNPPASSYSASQPWTPAVAGSHILEVLAYNVDNVSSSPAQLVINVYEAAAVTPVLPATVVTIGTLPAPPVVTSTPAGQATVMPPPSATPLASAPAGSAVDQVVGEPTLTAVIGVNVRSGPGVEYQPPIGWLAEGGTARITGRYIDGTWWQIEYPPNTQGRGWVSAKPQYTTALNTQNVPVVEAPPLPTSTPTPTITPTPTATPTPTPNPMRPVIYTFEADRYVINPGESVTLRWDLANAEAAYLRYDGAEEGVVAPGAKTVTPGGTTVYTLVARNAAGTTTAQLVITVNSPVGPVVMFDFVSAAPGATWTNGADALPWDGSIGDPRGFAKWRDGEQLEDGSRPSRALETHPEWVPNGNIIGSFTLPAPIRPGDRFKARVGFLAGASGEARFLVGVDGGTLPGFQLVASVDHTADGTLKTLEADLTTVAGGQRVWLVVQAGPSDERAQAVWVNPRIER
jgi:uncharacterized protein YraI